MGQSSKISSNSAIDWQGSDAQILLNPRWPAHELVRLRELAKTFSRGDLQNHIWVASSGSSSSSENSVKLIALPRTAFLASAKAVNTHLQSTADDVWGQVLPPFHVGGLGIEARAFVSGARVVDALLATGSEGIGHQWNASQFVEICEREKISLSALVPTQVFDLVSLRVQAPSSLRALIVGGAALSDDLYHQALDLGWPLLPSYGATETCSQVATAELRGIGHRDRKLVMLSHAKARVSPSGFLEFSGSSLLTGYAQWRGTERFFEDPKQDGWMTTQDRGEISDDHGQQILIPQGRDFEFVKIAGEGVQLLKLNEILASVVQKISPSAVQQVVVIAAPDARTENRIEIVIGTNQLSAADVLHLCQQFNALVAPYEKIRKEHFVSEIPRSPLGKVLWAQLRELLK
jgi:O-succinylbenzoic acid--CoA ligase